LATSNFGNPSLARDELLFDGGAGEPEYSVAGTQVVFPE